MTAVRPLLTFGDAVEGVVDVVVGEADVLFPPSDDATRVPLTSAVSGDYINANFVNMEIPGSGVVNRYIAAQGERGRKGGRRGRREKESWRKGEGAGASKWLSFGWPERETDLWF